MRTGLSITLIALGPFLMVLALVTALLQRNRRGSIAESWAARLILAAAVLASGLVTAGILLYWG